MTDRDRHTWREYKVEVTVQHEPEGFTQCISNLETDWKRDRDVVINLAEEMRESGYMAEIKTREYQSYAAKDFDSIPSRNPQSD